MATPKIVFALDTCSLREPGSKYPTSVTKGTAWYADSPLVRAYPDLFASKPTEVFPRNWVSPAVEQATAAPGEKRATRRAD